jgi:hypothetical protein
MHLEAVLSDSGSSDARVRVADGWDATLFEPSFRHHLRQRIRALGGRRSPERTAVELRRTVAHDLAAWWRDCGSNRWSGHGGALDAAREVVVRESARELSASLATLARRGTETPLAIWESWLHLRECHFTLVHLCGSARLRAFYGALEHTVAALVVDLHSRRGQRSLAHAISLWLVQEAERVHDASAAAHHRMAVVLGP